MKNVNIGLGEIVYTEDKKMPLLEVVGKDDNQVVLFTHYLSPFRGYSFQVSRSIGGDHDYASSEVIGLGNIVHMTPQYPEMPNSFSAFASNVSAAFYSRAIFKAFATSVLGKYAETIEWQLRYLIKVDENTPEEDKYDDGDGVRVNTVCKFFGSTQNRNIMNEFIDKCYYYVDEVTRPYFQ